MARQKLGPKNVFTFNGKTYNTNLAGEGVSSNKGVSQNRTNKTNIPEGYTEVKNINNTGSTKSTNTPVEKGNKKITQEDIKKLGELPIPQKAKNKVSTNTSTKSKDGFDVRNNIYNFEGKKLSRQQLVNKRKIY
jgi:hypothetical protein